MARAKKEEAVAPVDFSEGDSLMVDFSSTEDLGEREVLSKGMYPCIIAENEFGYSQSKGTPMWTFVLEVRDGEYAGRKLYSHHVLAGKGLPFTKRTFSRIAPELFEGAFDPEDEEVISSMLGKHVKAKVTVGKYDGEATNSVRELYADEEGDSFV